MAALPPGQRAAVVEYGRDQLDAIDRCLVLQPMPAPVAADLQDGDVAVAVRATEIVWTDTVMMTGQYQHQARLPYAPGMTYAGDVVLTTPKAVAAGLSVGTKVAIAGWNAGPRSHGRYQQYGGCATYAIAPMSAVRRVPANWSYAECSCFAYGYDTAYHCLREVGQVKPGETVLVHGATGGVGIPAVQLARALGATVIAATRSATKVDFLKSLGAHHVVVLPDKGGFAKEVKGLTGGKGADVVYDGVGGDAITVESMRALRFGGRLLIVGWAATPNVAKGAGQRGSANANRIPTNLIMMKSLRVLGCPAMIAAKADPSIATRRVAELTQWILEGKLPPPIVGETFPLADVKTALKRRVASGSTVGSTVVLVENDHGSLPSRL